jgi:glycosyltransferase involved in cell wall biosynthesis
LNIAGWVIKEHVLPSGEYNSAHNVVAVAEPIRAGRAAMACGTPCVATDVGDARRIIGTTGWMVPPADSRALAHAIDAALGARKHAPTWRERQRACRTRIVENFSLPRMIERYETAWRQILGKAIAGRNRQ